jgi:hypothetical protein
VAGGGEAFDIDLTWAPLAQGLQAAAQPYRPGWAFQGLSAGGVDLRQDRMAARSQCPFA